MKMFDLVFYAALLLLSLKLCLEALVRARGYRGRFVRPGLRLLLALWAALAIAWAFGFRIEVATTLPSSILHLPPAALVVAMLYFAAEAAFRDAWGSAEPE